MELLSQPEVKSIIRTCLESGSVRFTKHATEELLKDGLTSADVVNVLRGGSVEPGEIVHGKACRYRVRTAKIVVVIELEAGTQLVVVTAWRMKK